MGVKIKTTVNKLPAMMAAAQSLHGRKVQVGVIGEEAWLAGIHEYGCHIQVTPKMRAYLHSQGLHLKASTTVIVIPERAFLRNGFDQGKEQAEDVADKMVGRVLEGKLTEDAMLKAIGLSLKSVIQNYARDLRDPPNHRFTVGRKHSSNPLVDSGDLIAHIMYEVL